MRMVLFVVLMLCFASSSQARIPKDMFQQNIFDCYIIGIIDDGRNGSFEFDFTVDLNKQGGGTHGGDERVFNYEKDEVVVIANDRWLGLAWWRGGRKLGETVNLQTDLSTQSRVLILMNPENDNERVSITCDLRAKATPKN
jgi:hypothetical protein